MILSPLGILTIAFGQKHTNLAINLAKSLIITNPHIKRAVVTNNEGAAVLKNYYDIIIPLQKNIKSNLYHKLLLNQYSPFEETLFIDADCLVYKDLFPVFELLSVQSFSNVGQEIADGEWYMDVKPVIKKLGLNSIPQINGGIYYFKKDETAHKIFKDAYDIAGQYTEIGLKPFSDGGINEEPVYALAMAKNGLSVVTDPNKITMYTPLGISGNFNVDFLTGKCRFIKRSVKVSPSVIHFCGDITQKFHYKREVEKINLCYANRNKLLINLYITLKHNLPYCLFVFSKRLTKKIIGRKDIRFHPILPIYSNS